MNFKYFTFLIFIILKTQFVFGQTSSIPPEFTGQSYQASSSLYYFQNRYYLPQFGRFLTPDPLSQYPSSYGYSNGEPLNFTDPSGLIFEELGGLVRSAFRSLTSCCRSSAVEVEEEELSVQPEGGRVGRESVRHGVSNSKGLELLNVQASVSQQAGITSGAKGIISGGARAEYQEDFPTKIKTKYKDPILDPGLHERLHDIDNKYRERVDQLKKTTELAVHRINSSGEYEVMTKGEGAFFHVKYSPTTIDILNIFRGINKPFYGSDIIRDQYQEVFSRGSSPREYSPRKIANLGIINQRTLKAIKGYYNSDRIEEVQSELISLFLKTPNGRLVQRVMDDFDLQADAIIYDGAHDVKLFTSPKSQ